MYKKTFILSFFCLLTSVLWGQSVNLVGYVLSAEDDSPLPGAFVAVQGEKGTYSGSDGLFVLELDNSEPVTLVIKLLGYNSQILEVNPGTQKQLEFKLVPDPITLSPTLITDQAVRKIHPDNETYIKDYTFLGDHYLLIVFDREYRRNKIVLLSRDMVTLAEHYGLGEEPQTLVTDCMGLKHFFSKTQACQVDYVEEKLIVQKSERRAYEELVTPCKTRLNGTYFFEEKLNIYTSIFFYIQENERVKRGFYLTADSTSLSILEDEATIDARMAAPVDYNRYLEALDPIYLNQIQCPPAYVPIYKVKDKVVLFDYNQDKIVRFDEGAVKEEEIAIDFHKKRFWEREMVISEEENRAFAVYERMGKITLAEISVEDGSILREVDLPKQFVSNIHVKGDEVFFLYKDKLEDPIKRLYAFDMKW